MKIASTKTFLLSIVMLIIGSMITLSFTYIYDLYKEKIAYKQQIRNKQLEVIDKQLNDFYIPLKTNIDTSDNNELDASLDALEQHIAYYNVIFMQWADKDVTENFAPTHFPDELIQFLEEDIIKLNLKKKRLLEE
jgi:hypothetical protein